MWTLRIVAALALLASAGGVAAQAGLGTVWVENWVYYQENTDSTGRWQYRPKLFVPYHFENGWTFTQRVDVPIYYTDKSGPANPGGGWKGGLSDIFIEEIFDTPEIMKDLRLKASVRFVFPTGGQEPFGSDQYQWAPMVGLTYRRPDLWRGVTIEPVVRYFSGFDTRNDATRVQRLDIYPHVTFGLNDTWSVGLYNPETPISFNTATDNWFVPIDVMLSNRLNKTWELGIGGAYAIVKDDPQYQYIIDARLIIHF
jgi:hypothetical protein